MESNHRVEGKPTIPSVYEMRMAMTDVTSMDFQPWALGEPTKNPPNDEFFLEAVVKAGFNAFTHHGGLCGGRSGLRATHVIHRGRGKKWEVIFLENDSDVLSTTTTDLGNMTTTILLWLRGAALSAEENSVRAVAG